MYGDALSHLNMRNVESVFDQCIGRDGNLPLVRIQLTGRVTVESDHAVVSERLFARQTRVLFSLLVIERARPVPREELAEVLWPSGLPRTWDAALRGIVSKIRTFLTAAGLPESVTLYRGFGAYQLQLPANVAIDIELAHFALEAAERVLRQGDPARAVKFAEYTRAVAASPFLSYEKGCWIERIRDRLRKDLLAALCVLGEGYFQQGEYRLAAGAAEDTIALEPFREQVHQLLMRTHMAAGNPAEALSAYERCRRLLADELGVNPAAKTAALHLALLQDDCRRSD